jgi:hypothetical protein
VYYNLVGATTACSAKDSVTITINAIDTAKITRNQGPFCVSENAINLKKETVSSAGTWSGTGITNASLGTFDPAIATLGKHLISYKTDGTCAITDTLTVIVVNQKQADIIETDISKCKNAAAFDLTLSANTTAGGTWSSKPAGKVSATGKVDRILQVLGYLKCIIN